MKQYKKYVIPYKSAFILGPIFMIVELVNATCYNVILQKQPVTLEELKPELNTAICGIISQFEIADTEQE